MSRTNWQFPRRKARQADAIERQAYYDSLPTNQKLELCDIRRGESTRERIRLERTT